MITIEASILSADFARLGEQAREAEAAGVDAIQVDVMDGSFVPDITFGPGVVRALRRLVKLPLDVHLMIETPEDYIPQFAQAGADIITVHVEACNHLHRVVESIKEGGSRAGVSLNPSTSLSTIEEILPFVDLILVMSVNPGFGGQKFIESSVDKITRLRRMLDERGLDAEIEVDGGINEDIAPRVAGAGATVLVAGAAVFNRKESVAEAVAKIRESVSGLEER